MCWCKFKLLNEVTWISCFSFWGVLNKIMLHAFVDCNSNSVFTRISSPLSHSITNKSISCLGVALCTYKTSCAPNNFWKFHKYPFLITSSLSLFDHALFFFSLPSPSFSWEVLVGCVLFDYGGSSVSGYTINGGGKVSNLDLFFLRKTYGLIIRKLYKIYGLVICKKHTNCQLDNP